MSDFYNNQYYRERYISPLFSKIGLSNVYYLWIAFFCLILPAKLKKGDVAFEMGCGVGNLVWALRLFGIEAYGFDTSPAGKKYCRVNAYCVYGTQFKAAYDKKINQKQIKLLYSSEVLEHMSIQESTDLFNSEISKKASCSIHMICTKERQIDPQHDKTHINVQSIDWWNRFIRNRKYYVKHGNPYYFFPSFFERGINIWGLKTGYFYCKYESNRKKN